MKEKLRTNKHNSKKPKEQPIWILRFDDSKFKLGVGAGIELINPKGRPFYFVYRLQFRCNKKVAKYEALIHRILFALEKDVKALVVEGDSQLVIRQVKSIYSFNDRRLLAYQKRVWDLMENFEALNIRSIPRRRNMIVNALAISASALQLVERTKLKIFLVELISALSIPNNILNFQVFYDDQHILEFIMCNAIFKGQEIDDTFDDKLKDDELEDEDEIINLKTNTIPKGMAELECIFDKDKSTCNKIIVEEKGIGQCDSYNLDRNEDPKMVRIGKTCNPQE